MNRYPRGRYRTASIAPIRNCVTDTTVRPSTPPYEPLIGIAELADWLAVSEHTVRKWVTRGPESGLIPRVIRLNGVTRFRPQDVRAWLDSKVVAP